MTVRTVINPRLAGYVFDEARKMLIKKNVDADVQGVANRAPKKHLQSSRQYSENEIVEPYIDYSHMITSLQNKQVWY